jgi:hypothetical protein
VNWTLYDRVAQTVGIRRLAAAEVHRQLAERFPRLDLRTELRGRVVFVDARWGRWWWLLGGLYHFVRWRQLVALARWALLLVSADVRLEVKVTRWGKISSSPSPSSPISPRL